MLMDTDLDVTQQDYVRTAQASGKALVSLINEVLDQAKIESGKLELEDVQFNLRAILDDVLSLFSDKSQVKGVEVYSCGEIIVYWWCMMCTCKSHIILILTINFRVPDNFYSIALHFS